MYAFFLNLILAAVKSGFTVSSESFAVTAGAIDSASDSVASLAVYFGILFSSRSTRSFPLGLYKLENLLSSVIALFIFITGYELGRRVLFGGQTVPSISPIVLVGMGATTLAIYLHDLDYFATVLSTKADDSRSPAEVELLIAEYDGCPLAAMFLVYSATRATYLYGASSSNHRHVMAPYLLQWQAMQSAKAKGCSDYDMFGVAPSPDPAHAMYGLYRFKTGFGGYLFHRMGCWDYPLDQQRYEVFRSLEMNSQGYHLN